MSLLLEALKKAEKAKEDAQRKAKAGAAAGIAASVFDPESTVMDDGRHVTTRDELPDISAPLEILSDDLRPAPFASQPPLALADAPPAAAPAPREPKPAPRREAPRAAGGAAASREPAANTERATAQRVFEAKFREPNPRLPFYITMAVLSAFAVGTVAYFWIQLRPPPALVNTSPVRSPDEKPVEVSAQPPAGTAAAPAAAVIPGLPNAAPPPAPAASAAAAPPSPAAAPSAAVAAPGPAPAVAKPAPAAPRERAASTRRGQPGEERTVTINRGGPQVHPQVASGYAAYQAGDLAKARADYQQVVREEPANRDALLGLAAVEMRAQRFDLADRYYQVLLQIDPRDPYAQAGMVALRGQQLDPVQVESRVKSMIASDRDSSVLQFTLGNQFAQQGRWAEAQQAYFKAFTADPDNPDFAFNLAISMDQMRRPKLALEYYRRALALAEKRSANFALGVANERVRQLSR